MRILMLTQFYPPDIGGEERHVQDLSIQLTKNGHEVSVATLWHPGLPDFEVDCGVRIYRVKGTTQRAGWLFSESERRHAPPFPDPETVFEIQHVIQRERPEIIHAHNWLLYSFLPLKSWVGAPLVVTLHDYSLRCAKKRLMYQGSLCSGPALAKCLACASDHYGLAKGATTALLSRVMGEAGRAAVDLFVAVSEATAAGNGLPDSGLPYRVIPNFIPDELEAHQESVEPYLCQLPDEDYLLYVGDITQDKGVHILLRAYAGLEGAPPLVLIGREVRELPADLPPNVYFLGRWPHPAVMEAWRRCKIALVPSVWPEPFGIVAIEAMASGRPVIASRTGGLVDIVVDGETGLLVPPGDVPALQQALWTLLADPELRGRMGQAARLKVKEFTASAIVGQIEDAYRSLLDAEKVKQKQRRSWFGGSWHAKEL
jgi:glycosyltransferase involved in cell wall biosynthesis